MSLAGAKVMIDLVFMQIAVVFHKFPNRAVKLLKMFPLKPLKIDLNTVPETVVFSVCGCVFIEFMYCILLKGVNVSRLNGFAVVKEDFSVGSLGVL